jgi:hypothetical protein
MQPLEKSLRNKLEKTVKDARDIAEDSARAALDQLGVGEPTAYQHLTEADRDLRRKLRAHGRQLGNGRNAKSEQALDRLIEEVAYEHWHRMLFARFLAENNLLMYPDPDDPVAVTLEECEDLAADEGASNGWELASRYAARMLPQIFRPDSPVFQLTLPPEHQQKLERLIADLSQEVFTASDSLGWVYQFWQAKKKGEINASEVKIGARELPAVTQLFTEPYMVSFLLDNSLGAWWAARRLTEADLKNAKTEDELRRKASLPGVALEYLRFVKGEDGKWIPAAGTFNGWPEKLAELKTLDPCCGSGHFFVAAFLMLVPMRMEREGLSARQAVDRVLSENIHGLELDQRCVEIAAFALALTAWKYPEAGGYRPLPELNVACSGLSVSVAKEEWKQLAIDKHNLRIAMDWMYDVFSDAPILGSLLDPYRSDAAKIVQWQELSKTLEDALIHEQTDERYEMGVVAHGLSKAAMLLAAKYSWVITNVPYLGRVKQDERLRKFCDRHYGASKNDLSTVFLERCLSFCDEGGTTCVVLPQNWLFLSSYKKVRKNLLKSETWNLISRLGPGAFETISGEVVKAILIVLTRKNPRIGSSNLFDTELSESIKNLISGCDVSEYKTVDEKANQLKNCRIISVSQADQLNNPDSTIILDEANSTLKLLGHFSTVVQGVGSTDAPRFIVRFWEIHGFSSTWDYYQMAPTGSLFSGATSLLQWENGEGDLAQIGTARKGLPAVGKRGFGIAVNSNPHASIFMKHRFDCTTAVLLPNDNQYESAIGTFLRDGSFPDEARKVDQALSITESSFSKIPFDLDHWTKIADEKHPNGLPKPYSDDPTQWIFHGHPCGSVVWAEEKKWTTIGSLRTDATVLQVAVARLLGYRWSAETDPDMELSDESRALVKKTQELLPFADDDGIVCIPPVRGEMKAEDRLENLLAAAYGSEWSSNKKAELLARAGHAGKTLETWLRDKFFTQHCKLFHHRPFIWHIWDGLHDGFAALVNYHKLDAKLLETLIYNYLGDWISRQKQGIANGVDGAQEKLSAAEVLKKKLELILEGEAPHDIFVRWKPIEKQPIGWNPDLNDGVRLNIRPFMAVPDVGKKGAGILRDKPNIKWGKDRGKDVASAPWYHLGPIYGGNEGDRINDHHLSLEEKKRVHEKHGRHEKNG